MSPRHEPGRLRSGYAPPPSAWLNHHKGGQEFCRQGGSIHLSLDTYNDGTCHVVRHAWSIGAAHPARGLKPAPTTTGCMMPFATHRPARPTARPRLGRRRL